MECCGPSDEWDRPLPDEPPVPHRTPDSPTRYGPGSREKIEVMRHRYERGEALYHELDSGTCRSLPEVEEGKTYTSGSVPCLTLRNHCGGQDWFVSTWVHAIQVVKRFAIDQHDEAIRFVEEVKKGLGVFVAYQLKLDDLQGVKEVVTRFKHHVMGRKVSK